MSSRPLGFVVPALAGLILSAPVLAADLPRKSAPPALPVSQTNPFLSEIRGGVFAHDPWSPEKNSVDINGEVLFAKPFTVADPLLNALIPRPHLGATVNTNGKTSHAYAGFAWTYDITPSFFVEAAFGAGINNGKTGAIVPNDRSAVGCAWNFHESASLGYRFTRNWSVMGTVEHISNAGLCNQNRGITNVGMRVGYSF